MAENSKLTGIEVNGIFYSLGKSIYDELDITLERFAELLGRDLYCPTLSAAPTSSTLTYTDTDGSVNSFQVGQPCRWVEGNGYRLAICKDATASATEWYILPDRFVEVLKFENMSASSWVSDTTYVDYPYRCDVTCEGVKATDYPEVVFGLTQAVSGDYAPLAETKQNVVSIWSKSNETITIPTIIITR